MGINQWTIALTVIFIFSIAMINFGVQFGLEQNAAININNDTEIAGYSSSSQSNMVSFTSEGNDSLTSFEESTIEETSASGTLVTGASFKAPPKRPLSVLKNTIGLGFSKIFGGNSSFDVVLTSLFTLIALIGAFLIWKAWKGGNTD